MEQIPESELILNPDGSIFHLHLLPEQIADTVLLVGDPARVDLISAYFQSIECEVRNREFVTKTGIYEGKRISVVATGIGTDNIDIVVNELDALVNIDLKTRKVKENLKKLNLIRVGTSGALQEDIAVDSFLLSEMAIGFDGMLNYYKGRDSVSRLDIEKAFIKYMDWNEKIATPYFVESSESLLSFFNEDFVRGTTISAPGFYGPQGRELRLKIQDPDINEKIRGFRFDNHRITNYEMECSAIYGLSKLLGHQAATVCLIIANRYRHQYSKDYKPGMKKLVEALLQTVLKFA